MKRSKWAIAAALAVLVAAALCGCASKPAEPVKLTAADSGSTQALAVGQTLEIALDSNPTTGYQWAVDGGLPPQLAQVGVAHKAASDALGAGGVDTWTFTGKSPGSATLKLKYWRSFEPTAVPENTFEVVVEVQ